MKKPKTEIEIRQRHSRLSRQLDEMWATRLPASLIHQLRYKLDMALASDLKNLE